MTNYAETEEDVSSGEGEPVEDPEEEQEEEKDEEESSSESEDDLVRRHRIAADIWEHESIDPFGSLGEVSCPSGTDHLSLRSCS